MSRKDEAKALGKKRFTQKMEFEHESGLLMVEDPIVLWPPFLWSNNELELRRSLPGLEEGNTLQCVIASTAPCTSRILKPFIID